MCIFLYLVAFLSSNMFGSSATCLEHLQLLWFQELVELSKKFIDHDASIVRMLCINCKGYYSTSLLSLSIHQRNLQPHGFVWKEESWTDISHVSLCYKIEPWIDHHQHCKTCWDAIDITHFVTLTRFRTPWHASVCWMNFSTSASELLTVWVSKAQFGFQNFL